MAIVLLLFINPITVIVPFRVIPKTENAKKNLIFCSSFSQQKLLLCFFTLPEKVLSQLPPTSPPNPTCAERRALPQRKVTTYVAQQDDLSAWRQDFSDAIVLHHRGQSGTSPG